jgi:hypothetical protein
MRLAVLRLIRMNTLKRHLYYLALGVPLILAVIVCAFSGQLNSALGLAILSLITVWFCGLVFALSAVANYFYERGHGPSS